MSDLTFTDFQNIINDPNIDTSWLTTYDIDLNDASYADFASSENFTGSFNWTDYSGLLSDTSDTSSTTNKQETNNTVRKRPKRALRKINGGRVLKYPIDIDVNLQDYFEMQVFKYRPAGRLPNLTDSTEEQLGSDSEMAGYNRRYNRQNLRLEELQSTIQIPIPNSLKDNNTVGWGEGEMSGLLGQLGGPTIERLLGGNDPDGLLKGGLDAAKETFANASELFGKTGPLKQFRRRAALNLIAQAAGTIGVNIDIDQAVTRVNGTIINPNMELLFSGPSLRTFTFTIRFTPRSPEESERIRMIIRVLKQHSAVKRNPKINSTEVYANDIGSNFLLGTPDVFKLRYIKAKTQKDIKGLNKFKTCALKSVSVDYTGEAGRFAGYDIDSQPVTTLVTLTFNELVPIYDEDYHEFTNDDDVGL